MNGNFISALLVAWILTWFNFDHHLIIGFNELTSMNITISGYYVLFFLVGLAADLFYMIKYK